MNKQTAGGIEMSDKMREAFEKWLDQGNHCGCNENMWKAWQAAQSVPVDAELVALRKDAERYRWLRGGLESSPTDAVIDAAIAKERQS